MPVSEEVFKYQQNKLLNFPLHYAHKYGIEMGGKTHRDIMTLIHNFEMKNLKKLIDSRDNYTKEYGYFILADK